MHTFKLWQYRAAQGLLRGITCGGKIISRARQKPTEGLLRASTGIKKDTPRRACLVAIKPRAALWSLLSVAISSARVKAHILYRLQASFVKGMQVMRRDNFSAVMSKAYRSIMQGFAVIYGRTSATMVPLRPLEGLHVAGF